MAVSTAEKISINFLLNDGVDSEGNTKYVSTPLGNINLANFDADKVLTIKNLLQHCMVKTISKVQKVEYSIITASA